MNFEQFSSTREENKTMFRQISSQLKNSYFSSTPLPAAAISESWEVVFICIIWSS